MSASNTDTSTMTMTTTQHGGLAGTSTKNTPNNHQHHLINKRIQIDGTTATIRYHGTIPRKPGKNWLGIEWDDANRGKHSGTIDTGTGDGSVVQVFRTRVDGAGSFVSASRPGIEWGTGFVAALRDKYLCGQPSDGVVVLGERVGDGDGDQSMGCVTGLATAASATSPDTVYSAATHSTTVSGHVSGRIHVETVGWDKIARKQSKLEHIQEIGLAAQNIATAVSDTDTEDDISRLCASVVDLDLSKNLFATWIEVARIVRHMPTLRILRLSANRLMLPRVASSVTTNEASDVDHDHDERARDTTEMVQAFGRIKQVTLMRTMMDWKEVAAIEQWFTNLEELHVGLNGMTYVGRHETPFKSIGSDPAIDGDARNDNPDTGAIRMETKLLPVTGFAHLHTLNLEGNNITSWEDVARLAWLPQLSVLNLSDNAIETVLPTTAIKRDTDNDDDNDTIVSPITGTPFEKLRALNLSGNRLTSWMDIHSLNSYKNLVDVRLKRNPVVLSAGRNVFWDLVARLGRVTLVNGSQVTSRDRLNGELAYLSSCAREKPQMDTDAFEAMHPRYAALCVSHGTPSAAPDALVSGKLRDRLLQVKAVHVERGRVEDRRLPRTLRLRAARMLLQRVFGDGAGVSMDLLWVRSGTRNDTKSPEQMSAAEIRRIGIVLEDDERRDLNDAGVESGDILALVSR